MLRVPLDADMLVAAAALARERPKSAGKVPANLVCFMRCEPNRQYTMKALNTPGWASNFSMPSIAHCS